MSEETNENLDSENQATEQVVENTEDTQSTEEQPEFTEAEKKLYARTKKAEADAKLAKKELAELKKAPPIVKTDGFSLKDSYALQEAKVHIDDVDEVADYAKFKGISIPEALKTSAVKSILADKAEARNTAEAANTTTVKKGSVKLSDEALIEKAQSGKEMTEAEIKEVVAAQWRVREKAGK